MSPRVQKELHNIAKMPNPVKGPGSVGNYPVNPSVLACMEDRNCNKKLTQNSFLGLTVCQSQPRRLRTPPVLLTGGCGSPLKVGSGIFDAQELVQDVAAAQVV